MPNFLFKVFKGLKINIYFIILHFGLIIRLKIENGRMFLFDAKKIA